MPEIRRCPLERLVLLAKMLEMGPPSDILALAMDPPDLSNIHRTTLVLKEVRDWNYTSLDSLLTSINMSNVCNIVSSFIAMLFID